MKKPRWWNGRHAAFRAQCPKGRASSNLALGTMDKITELDADKKGYCAFDGCNEIGVTEVVPAKEVSEMWSGIYGLNGRLQLCVKHTSMLLKQSISISVQKKVDTKGDEN